jgi:hypothetical protein
MKTSCTVFAAFLALGASASAFAATAPKENPPIMHPVKAVARAGIVVVTPGMSAYEVGKFLGAPKRKIGTDIWVYTGFDGGSEQARTDDSSVLLITFTDGAVSEIRLVNPRAEKAIAAHFDEKANAGALVVATGR